MQETLFKNEQLVGRRGKAVTRKKRIAVPHTYGVRGYAQGNLERTCRCGGPDAKTLYLRRTLTAR
jgi:hypothetical protein